MIIMTSVEGELEGNFKDYNDLCDYLAEIENAKLIAKKPDFRTMKWSFTIHPPRRVAAFYAHFKDSCECEAIEEAYEENLPLIEICTGDVNKPTYFALTPNVDLDYLKKKWCIDYCTFHQFVVREV